MKTDKEIFLEAYALVKNPDTWCRGFFAKNANGEYVRWDNSEACKFCSLGALYRSAGQASGACVVENALEMAVQERLPYIGVARFNDHMSHSEVCDLWEKVGRDNGWL